MDELLRHLLQFTIKCARLCSVITKKKKGWQLWSWRSSRPTRVTLESETHHNTRTQPLLMTVRVQIQDVLLSSSHQTPFEQRPSVIHTLHYDLLGWTGITALLNRVHFAVIQPLRCSLHQHSWSPTTAKNQANTHWIGKFLHSDSLLSYLSCTAEFANR